MGLPTDLPTIGARLKFAREEIAGLSTVKLAEALKGQGLEAGEGAEAPSVTRYENSDRTPKLEWISAFARATGVPLDWLVLNRTSPGEAGYVIERMRRLLDELESRPAGDRLALGQAAIAAADAAAGLRELAPEKPQVPGKSRRHRKSS